MKARSNARAYDRYLAAMDASMRQKVAVLAAHILGRGRVADMGMGSGTGTDALAALYPALNVVGVDLDPEIVERARKRFDRDNLDFAVGDIAERVFPDASLDGVFNSSVLHHVTSFGGYTYEAAARAIAAQAAQLRTGGTVVIRDFVAPPDNDLVWLDLPSDDGDTSDDPATCSTAHLFERFAREFRSLHDAPGFTYTRLEDPRSGWRRYQLPHRLAVEMILRKDYRQDWNNEVREEYCYYTQTEFEGVFTRLGLRVLASTPIRNPWIVKNRFVGKMALYRDDGTPIETTATNYIIAGEKVGEDEGVAFRHTPTEPVGYLQLEGWRDVRTGRVYDLARRPVRTTDVVPWFVDERGELAVLARMSYPRPLLQHDVVALDGSRPPAYVTEPLVVTDEAPDAVVTRLGFRVQRVAQGTPYYPSPGGILESVRCAYVEIDACWTAQPESGRSGFASPARVRAIDAGQVLRAAQVGALPDPRTELAVYALTSRLDDSLGPWIGDTFELADATGTASAIEPLLHDTRSHFERTDALSGFLRVEPYSWVELNRHDEPLATQTLELVTPAPFSNRTMSCALLARINGVTCIAIDDDDRPAAMALEGSSRLLVPPAFRLPAAITTLPHATRWVRERLHAQYGVEAAPLGELGGRYHPAPGLTPEVVHPFVWTTAVAVPTLHWVPLSDAARHAQTLPDMHLRIAILRSAHAVRETG